MAETKLSSPKRKVLTSKHNEEIVEQALKLQTQRVVDVPAAGDSQVALQLRRSSLSVPLSNDFLLSA